MKVDNRKSVGSSSSSSGGGGTVKAMESKPTQSSRTRHRTGRREKKRNNVHTIKAPANKHTHCTERSKCGICQDDWRVKKARRRRRRLAFTLYPVTMCKHTDYCRERKKFVEWIKSKEKRNEFVKIENAKENRSKNDTRVCARVFCC